MITLLHILTRDDDALSLRVRTEQAKQADTQVVTVDLRGDRPDYTALLEVMFSADSIAVW
jgi:hypothetical protein